jgi:phospholipid N-methyltransferase
MTARPKFSDHFNLIKNIRSTGTIAPSSPALIKKMLATIDFDSARCIVELGPGNGCITRELLSRIHPDCKLICFELNNEFVEQLQTINDERLKVVNACASSIRTVLDELQIECVDYVVSSLPLAIMDNAVVTSVVESVRDNLREGGRFLQYQYSLNNYDDVKLAFRESRLRFTLRNMPPAFIYDCVK